MSDKFQSRRLFEFFCEDCKEGSEHFIYSLDEKPECPTCLGHNMTRILSTPRIGWRQMGVDTGFPSAAAKWEKMQRNKARTDKGSLRGDGAPNLKMY